MSDHLFELLWWSGCPSHGEALTMFRDVLEDRGEDPGGVRRVQMITMEDAATEGFVGSPTFRVDGRDVLAVEPVVPALTCRMYFRRDGRPSPLPDREQLAEAVATALAAA